MARSKRLTTSAASSKRIKTRKNLETIGFLLQKIPETPKTHAYSERNPKQTTGLTEPGDT